MKKWNGYLLPFVSAAAFTLSSCSHGDTRHHAHWSYEGHGGPEHWGELQSEFKTCSIGKKQSPIDLQPQKGRTVGRPDISIAYAATPMRTINNGHTVQLDVESNSTAVIAGQQYRLLQLHFHAPSEHTVNGKAYPLEVHLVHRNAGGGLAVVGVFFEEGAANPALQPLLQSFPHDVGQSGDPGTMYDISSLVPAATGYLRYQGSLTTPPCTEGVLWSVARRSLPASLEQIKFFEKNFYQANARPVQPMNDRTLDIYQ